MMISDFFQMKIRDYYRLFMNSHILEYAIDVSKDVDGLTVLSQGKLFNNEEAFVPCTPKGILEIFDYYKINLEGKHVVIVGRSNLVSKPLIIIRLSFRKL